MSKLPYPKSALDANQVLQYAFSDDDQALRTTATFSGSVSVNLTAANDSIAIGDPDNGNTLDINADGSINANVVVSHLDDSIKIGDGVDFLAINPDGSINVKGGADHFLTQATDNVAIGDGTNLVTVTPSKGLNVTIPDSVTASTNLTALNSAVFLNISGLNSVGFQINSGTLIGTLIAESSVDNGINWTTVPFYDPANSTTLNTIPFTSANTLRIVSIIPLGGSSNVRVRVLSYTSGSATSLLRASTVAGTAGAITVAAFGSVVNNFVAITANTPTLVLAANPNRKYAYISNTSASAIRMQMSSSTGLTTSTGLPIQADGYYEFRGDNLFTGDIYIISSNSISIAATEGSP